MITRATNPAATRRSAGPEADLPREIGAWLRIEEDGHVTVFTGKVDVGQGSRTSLAQVVAEELRLPVSAMQLVMADTALVPFDMGTFGSRTTPSMAPRLRQEAAALRERLLDLAAERWQTEHAGLEVRDGAVRDRRTGQTLTYSELAGGQRLTDVPGEDVPVTPAEQWTIAGSPVPKVAARAFVTGEHRFPSDITRPGLLHGKMLRAPALQATLESLDIAAAEAIPGVRVVREGDFVGVVADDELTATRALTAMRATWSSTPQPSRDELDSYLRTHPSDAADGRSGPGPTGQERGSIADGWAESLTTVRQTYRAAYIAHAPLEPRVGVAEWDGDHLTVWTGSQRPFGVRGELMNTFGLSSEQVRVIVPDTGSGYGGKHTGEAAIEAARLARALGRPVKVAWTREEEFACAYFRPAAVIDVASGLRADGTIAVWEFNNVNAGTAGLATPYAILNQRAAYHPCRSPLRQGSYRALAATANIFARETHMDELAALASTEPLAFRLQHLQDVRLRAVFEAAAARFGWGTAQPAAGHGCGLAGGTEKGSYVAACAEVAVEASGRVRVVRVVEAFECGAIINPDNLRNQVAGAIVQGLGGALFEQIDFAEGKILNGRFSRYRVPRFGDVPAIEVVLLNRPDLPSAGAGETPLVAIAPAIGNAIYQATGVRLRSLPLVPEGLIKGTP